MQNPETTPPTTQPSTVEDSRSVIVYEPPRITAKLQLEKVTLFSGDGGGGGGSIGDP